MVAIWKGDECEVVVDKEIWKEKSEKDFNAIIRVIKASIQDQPKWWRAGEDLKGTRKIKEDPIQDQPKWCRVGRI